MACLTAKKQLLIVLALVCWALGPQANALPAFPGAEGFGSTTPGGRGGRVLLVTNLEDSGPGSFRAACEAEGPRIVVFRTGGTIRLRKTVEIKHPFITIAGQSAPGGGICLRNVSSSEYVPLRIVTNDVVIRYLRIRPGPSDGPSPCVDALALEHGAANVVIDHCSLSWSTDETFQLWTDPHDITLQWSFVTEALHRSTHPKGAHSKGVILASRGANRVSVHHSLLAHNQDRNPRIGLSGNVDFVNNVIYNPDAMCQITDDYAKQLVNYVGNYVKPGPDSKTEPPTSAWSRYEIFARETGGFGFSIFVKDNIGPHRPDGRGEESAIVDPRDRQYVTSTRNPAPPVTTVSPSKAYELVLDQAGAALPMRDAVDLRIVNEVRTGTGRIIDHPSQVGGWPELAAGTPPEDNDLDGMSDAWERTHGFDPNEASDNKLDPDGDGYTNIEEFLNGTNPRSAEPAPTKEADSVTLTLMTYNVQAARHSTHTNKTRAKKPLSVTQDLEKIAAVIEKNKPDVLFLQEVMRFDRYVENIDEFKWLRERLGYPVGLFASGKADPVPPGTSEWGVAVLLRTGHIVSTEKHLLGSNRVLFRVTASIHGANVTFYCTHLGSGKIPQQAQVVGPVLKDHARSNGPVILAGDFNAKPESEALSPIRVSLGSVFTGSKEQPIDCFFVSEGIEVLSAQTVPDPTEASDHDPVICRLKIPLRP